MDTKIKNNAYPAPTAYPKDRFVNDLIADHVSADPHRVALIADDGEVTYRDLWGQTQRCARWLKDQGYGPGDIVGIMMDRGADMVAAVLGVWQAGAAYLPLDPQYPASRLTYMVEDSSPKCILTDGPDHGPDHEPDHRPDSRMNFGGTVVMQAFADLPHTPGAVVERPDRHPSFLPAYVMYTSGSTGKPKGVVNQHQAVMNFLSSMAVTPGISPEDRLLSVTTLAFDISILELFLPLSVGARVIIPHQDDATDGFALNELMDRHGATIVQGTPATWRLLLDAGWEGSPKVKALCGGEALTPALVSDLLGKVGSLWNMYGPTETTVWSSFKHITSPDDITVGLPIANTQFYVVDEAGAQCPTGAAGELWIGGDGVAIGYFGMEALTQERFSPNPFVQSLNARVYRTGDRARRLANGEVTILGREDQQVKVRDDL